MSIQAKVTYLILIVLQYGNRCAAVLVRTSNGKVIISVLVFCFDIPAFDDLSTVDLISMLR